MKYALHKARELVTKLGLNPDLDANVVHEAEQLVKAVLDDVHGAAIDKHTRNDVLDAITKLADKDVS